MLNLAPYRCFPFFTALPVHKRGPDYVRPQVKAFRTARKQRDLYDDPEIRVWAVAIGREGQNAYFVTTPRNVLFELMYGLRDHPEDRCVLEVIEENRPCHFYIDVDINREDNPEISEEDFYGMMCRIRQVTCDGLARLFDLNGESIRYIETDSTKARKFSRHLVFHLPGERPLESTQVAQTVARHIFMPYREEFSVKKTTKSGNVTELCIDMGVYTKNRLMRTTLSSKFGDDRPLHRIIPSGFPEEKLPEEVYWDSPEDWYDTLIVPTGDALAATCHSLDMIEEEVSAGTSGGGGSSSSSSTAKRSGPIVRSRVAATGDTMITLYGPPITQWSRVLPEFDVRSIQVVPMHGFVIATNTRDCPFVGRPHKRNKVYLWVNLRHGTIETRCFDAESPCKGNATVPRKWTTQMERAVEVTITSLFQLYPRTAQQYGDTENYLLRRIDVSL